MKQEHEAPDGMPNGDDALSAAIRQHATRHAAPAGLRAGLLAQAALVEAGQLSTPDKAGWLQRLAHAARARWHTAAVAFAVGVGCTLLLSPGLAPPALFPPLGAGHDLDSEVVALHVRAMQMGPLTEVTSSDRHTVKPWFQGRLDYAPPVHDLAADGYALRGGRVAMVRGQAVAALAYARRQHLIDVFVWPGAQDQPAQASVRRGFHVVQWTAGAMQYAAVSDLELADLQAFALLLAQRAATH